MSVELSPREEQVLFALADGRTTIEIADEMGVTTMTVTTYIKGVLHALNARNRAHAVAIAYHQGILKPIGAQ